MNVYKDRQYLVFDLDDGSQVKYDFASNQCIGKKGTRVQDLKHQLRGITLEEIFENCEDRNYAKFLRFLRAYGGMNGCSISNIGTILKNAPRLARFEQIFSAGIENVDTNFKYTINEVPSGLLRVCRKRGIKLGNQLFETYTAHPDACNTAFNLEYISLTPYDVYSALVKTKRVRDGKAYYWSYREEPVIGLLLTDYGYKAKPLFKWIDYLKTYEAIEDISTLISEIHDYASMMQKISPKFDRYPRHFLTTHRIATRNYNRLKVEFDEQAFKLRIKPEMERVIDGYAFIYPRSTVEIKDEAVSMHHCVASYIDRVIDGACDIIFMRYADDTKSSLVTCEVVDGKMRQYRARFNEPVSMQQEAVIRKWEKWYQYKLEGLNNEATAS